MSRFWELLASSVIIQGIITVAMVGTVIYMAIIGQEIPELLGTLAGLAVGFYFGSKSQHQLQAMTGR